MAPWVNVRPSSRFAPLMIGTRAKSPLPTASCGGIGRTEAARQHRPEQGAGVEHDKASHLHDAFR
jgi:hypothetical protein